MFCFVFKWVCFIGLCTEKRTPRTRRIFRTCMWICMFFVFYSSLARRTQRCQVRFGCCYFSSVLQGLRWGLLRSFLSLNSTHTLLDTLPTCFRHAGCAAVLLFFCSADGIRWMRPLKGGVLWATRERLHFGATMGRWKETISTGTGEHAFLWLGLLVSRCVAHSRVHSAEESVFYPRRVVTTYALRSAPVVVILLFLEDR